MGLREEKKQKTRNMILSKSMHLFLEKGVDNVGMRELAQNCDLGIGTYYNYFQSKDEVVISLIEELMSKFKNEQVSSLDLDLFELVKYLGHSRNLLAAFLPIALKIENTPHLKGVRKLLPGLSTAKHDQELFYQFINLSHFLLSNNELDTKVFYSKISRK